MKRLTLSALVLAATVATASAQSVSIPGSDDPAEFSWTLYRKVAAAKPGQNVLVSPYSAREAVGLAYLGARGETRDGLARALNTGPVEDFAASSRKVREDLLAADLKTTILIANSIWVRRDWTLRDAYVSRARKDFGADVFPREFGPATVVEADAWVAAKTQGMIKKAVDELRPDDDAVLLNAVYFKGTWRTPFDKARTAPKDFTLRSGKTVKRPRMAFSGVPRSGESRSFDYAEDDRLQAVRLPYGSGRLAMVLVLPARGTKLEALTAKMNGTWWRDLRSQMRPRLGAVELPRFKFKSTLSLNAPLKEMGAGLAFDPVRADFQDMSPAGKLSISDVQQSVLIEVDEQGTVAAAMTSAGLGSRGVAAHRPLPFSFVADRPFLFALEDSGTGTLLFLGSLQDPR